jgi:hypothetical protein
MLRRGRVFGGIADRFIGGDVDNFFDVFGFDVSMISTYVSASFGDSSLSATLVGCRSSLSSDLGVGWARINQRLNFGIISVKLVCFSKQEIF